MAPRHCARHARRWRPISQACIWSFVHRAPPDRGFRVLRKPSVRSAIAVGAVVLVFATACSRGDAEHTAVGNSAPATQAPAPAPALPPVATPDFATVSKLMNDAI